MFSRSILLHLVTSSFGENDDQYKTQDESRCEKSSPKGDVIDYA